jgi:hypothetical protein
MERIIWTVFEFFWGRFGRKKLVKKYRVWWQRFWIAVFVFLFLWGMKIFFEWWDGVVQFLNYVIWDNANQ